MADPVRAAVAAPTGRDRLTQVAYALDGQAAVADRPGQMVVLQHLAAEVRAIAAGYAVVQGEALDGLWEAHLDSEHATTPAEPTGVNRG